MRLVVGFRPYSREHAELRQGRGRREERGGKYENGWAGHAGGEQ